MISVVLAVCRLTRPWVHLRILHSNLHGPTTIDDRAYAWLPRSGHAAAGAVRRTPTPRVAAGTARTWARMGHEHELVNAFTHELSTADSNQ